MNENYRLLSDVAIFSELRTYIATVDLTNYITTENMLPNRGGVCEASTLPDVKKLPKYEPKDILLSNIRPYFKKIWYADKVGGCSNDVLVVKAKENIDPQFLYYVLSDNNFFNYSTVTSKGTKMPRGSKHAIMKYLVPNIDKPTQLKIADILSTYDELIENNNKRIAILEQMAENLYKEWFVRFRFPGYENAKFENGIPSGWEIQRIGELAKIGAGGDAPQDYSPVRTSEYPIPIYSNGIANDGLYGYGKKSTKKAKSITISARGTVGFTCLRFEPYLPIVRLLSIEPDSKLLDVYYLFHNLRNENIDGYGTSQQQITIPFLKKKKVIVPPIELQTRFAHFAEDNYNQINKLKESNTNLVKQRDLLLPRLMSRKLEV
jgi:type I restriction enzyme S subunit